MKTIHTMSLAERTRLESIAISLESDNALLERIVAARRHQTQLHREMLSKVKAGTEDSLLLLLQQVSVEFEVSFTELRSPMRHQRLVQPRWEYIRRAHDRGYGTTAIGRAINRDHGTVLHALQQLGLKQKELALG